ncbi:MAG: HDOD domain-containing protein [Kineosporiaceae bacterium]
MGRSGTIPATLSAKTVHIGRQPVYGADEQLYGYELLFRSHSEALASGVQTRDGDAATTDTILSAFSEFGIPDLLGDRFGFINLTRAFLVGQIPVPFEPDQAVLEILETVEIDEDVVQGARRLVADGYRLAMDDFVWTPQAGPLLDLAEVVKIDVLEQTWEDVLDVADRVRPHGVQLLAERIEDADMLQRCKDAGFVYFQGYHLGRPQVLTAESLSPGQAIALQLVARLGQPDVTPVMVEDILRTDPALTYRLLRIANSAANGLTREVSTIRDAVVIVGLARLRAWLVLLSLSGGRGSAEVLTGALALARTCELTARSAADVVPEVAFTLGMLHGLATSLGREVPQFVQGLPPLGADLDAALRGEPGPLRQVLDAVLAYQRRDSAEIARIGVTEQKVAQAYLSALAWAHRTTRASTI